jgi:hypothetical protein
MNMTLGVASSYRDEPAGMGSSLSKRRTKITITSGSGVPSSASMIWPSMRSSPEEQEHSNAAAYSRQIAHAADNPSVGRRSGRIRFPLCVSISSCRIYLERSRSDSAKFQLIRQCQAAITRPLSEEAQNGPAAWRARHGWSALRSKLGCGHRRLLHFQYFAGRESRAAWCRYLVAGPPGRCPLHSNCISLSFHASPRMGCQAAEASNRASATQCVPSS